MHENSIEFLSSTDKGAVGFILAQELAILILSIFTFGDWTHKRWYPLAVV